MLSLKQDEKGVLIPINPTSGKMEYNGVYLIIDNIPKKIAGCLKEIQTSRFLDGDHTGKPTRKRIIDGLSYDSLSSTLDEVLELIISGDNYGYILNELVWQLEYLEKLGIVMETGAYTLETSGVSYFNTNRMRNERHFGMRTIPKYGINYQGVLRKLFSGSIGIENIFTWLNQDQLKTLFQLGYNSLENEGTYDDVIGRTLFALIRKIGFQSTYKGIPHQKVIYGEMGNGISPTNKYTLPYIE